MDIEIGDLEWDTWNVDHIVRHGVAITDVEQVCRGRPRAEAANGGRVRVIGRTREGRVIVTILDPLGGGRFYCVTAFPATGRVRREFLDRERSGEA